MYYHKTSNYQNTNMAFNRDPAFAGDPTSNKHWPKAPLHLLMSLVPMFPIYVKFTLYVNS